jgi:hypothetical protein
VAREVFDRTWGRTDFEHHCTYTIGVNMLRNDEVAAPVRQPVKQKPAGKAAWWKKLLPW